MPPQEKQSELRRYRDILLATLDYLHELYAGSIIYDQVDPIADYYHQQKQQKNITSSEGSTGFSNGSEI